MPVQLEDNPFAMVYRSLWDLAMRSRDLEARVKVGNRIGYDSPDDRNIGKGKVQAGDMPELILVARSMAANLHSTSSSSSCTRQYAWMVSTGDFRYAQELSPLEWQIFCAMAGWRTTLTKLLWREKSFAKKMTLLGGPTGLHDAENNRNLRGWSAVWAVDVEMHFDTVDLDAEIDSKLELV